MTIICLVRHGETDWNKQGILQGQQETKLNTKGKQQAKITGAFLATMHHDFDILITSSLQRAKETAKIMNQHLHLPLYEMDILRERYFGDAEGLEITERQLKYPDNDFPGLEEEKVFYERVVAGFQEITTKHKNDHILIVSHGLVINLILSHIRNEEMNYKKTALLNGCINCIQLADDAWHVSGINEISHLKEYFTDL